MYDQVDERIGGEASVSRQQQERRIKPRTHINTFKTELPDKISRKELEGISSPPRAEGRNWFQSPTLTALNTLAADLSRRICEPLIDPTPTDGESLCLALSCLACCLCCVSVVPWWAETCSLREV